MHQAFRNPRQQALAALFLAFLVTAPATRLTAEQTNGLIAEYGFNEGTGNLAVDASADSNDGNIIGAVWTPGYFGNALYFDGAGTRVTVTNSQSLGLVTGMTLEAWVSPASDIGWTTVAAKAAFGNLAYGLFASSGAGHPAAVIITTDGLTSIEAPSAIPLNAWTHLAATYDSITLRLFVDGEEVASAPASGTILSSRDDFSIAGNTIYGEFFQGIIDEIRAYNRALTPAEIQADLDSPIVDLPSSPEELPNGHVPRFVRESHFATEGPMGTQFNRASLSMNIPGTNMLLIAAWHSEYDGDVPDQWTVQFAGIPGRLIVETNGYTGGDGNRRFRIYCWENPPPGSNSVLIVNPYNGPNELAASVILLTNVALAHPFGAIALDVSTDERSGETETVETTSNDLVVHIIADAVFVPGSLGIGEISRSIANDGKHIADGDASLWISTRFGEPFSTTVSSSDWASRVLNGVALVVRGIDLAPPALSPIPDKLISANRACGPILFTISEPDSEVTLDTLSIAAASSNPTLVPVNNIVFGGTSSNRTVSITPAAGEVGMATITITVSNGEVSSIQSFKLKVVPQPIVTISRVDSTLYISFPTLQDANYVLEYSDSTDQGDWSELLPVAGTGDLVTMPAPLSGSAQRFYKIRVE